MTKKKILIVDDEKDIVEILQYNLEQGGFNVVTAYDGEEALNKLSDKPDLIILDIMMPNLDGYETCTAIRNTKGFENTPIVFLTAKSNESDELTGLELGADDFILKPASPKKIVARVKSNLRKTNFISRDSNSIIEYGPIKIDRESFKVSIDGRYIFLPKKEFEILTYLAEKPGKVFRREKILDDIWGRDVYVVERTIDVHIRKIREKLGDYFYLIETIKGIGYRFKGDE